MKTQLISAKNISLNFSNQNKILDNIEININEKEIVTLIGPNGGGKTTLLRILLGFIKPTTGKVNRVKNLKIGYIPQKINIEPILPLTVKRFLTVSNSININSYDDLRPFINELNISNLLNVQIHNLSGGQMQKVLLIRALLSNPKLLVMDEPEQGLDINGQIELYEILSKIRIEKECAILMVSHDLHMVMASTDRVICLNNHICCQGSPQIVSNDIRYINLFGRKNKKNIAFYSHNHNRN